MHPANHGVRTGHSQSGCCYSSDSRGAYRAGTTGCIQATHSLGAWKSSSNKAHRHGVARSLSNYQRQNAALFTTNETGDLIDWHARRNSVSVLWMRIASTIAKCWNIRTMKRNVYGFMTAKPKMCSFMTTELNVRVFTTEKSTSYTCVGSRVTTRCCIHLPRSWFRRPPPNESFLLFLLWWFCSCIPPQLWDCSQAHSLFHIDLRPYTHQRAQELFRLQWGKGFIHSWCSARCYLSSATKTT